MNQNVVHPLRVHPDVILELEESLVLCDTGIAHQSGDIHQDQREVMTSADIRSKVQSNVKLTYEIRNLLLRGRLMEFGHALHSAWCLKRQFSSLISSPELDAIYEGALQHGAVGGKLLGAGGGGFFIFHSPPFRRHELVSHLRSLQLRVHPFRFEPSGLQAWSVREGKNSIVGRN
jgi:D-glycero-alpha-D-manno-heptose-7-phosphate kinase